MKLKEIEKKLFHYQIEGINLIVNKYHHVLLADHPGAGKTCQAILSAKFLKAKNILVICPASLKENWRREFNLWFISSGDEELTILSYEIASKMPEGINCDLLIIDECHYLKSPHSKRTNVILNQFWPRAKKVICISGTPLPNGRAIEGWSIFSKLCPEAFGDRQKYIDTYCIKTKTPWGINYDKSKNLKALGEICREKFMIRRERAETIGQLPDFIRFKVPLNEYYPETEYYELSDHLELSAEIRSEWRKHGLRKINASLEYLRNLLKEVNQCVVFAHHTDVLRELNQQLTEMHITNTLITGQTHVSLRQKYIDQFQAQDTRVFLASLHAASTGITLTAASDVVFVECDWVPSINEQAEGRCYRISQTQVTRFHYLVIPDSLDERITSAVLKKQKNILEVLKN